MEGFLETLLVLLLASVVAVPVFNRLRLGPVLAYLVAGVLVGPHVLGVVSTHDAEEGFEFGELGVVLLLFLIGLELSVGRLWLMRRAVFATGTLQVVATALLLAAVAVAVGIDGRVALVAGVALAMSSTAIGVQMLAERKELAHNYGRSALAVLLLQDLVAIPAIAILPVLGAAEAAAAGHDGATIAIAAAKVVGALAAVVVMGRYLVRPLFRFVAQTRSVEAFTACTLLVALGTAWLTALAGISMAMGAFLAGMMLAESEYRHEIEANIEPFKGLLLGLFFFAVGLSVDWTAVSDSAAWVAGAVLVLIAIKAAVLYTLGRTSEKLDAEDSLKLALVLSQGGEFAFVLLSLAARGGLIGVDIRDDLTAVVVLSMASTPLLMLALDRFLAQRAAAPKRPYDEIPEDDKPRVIIAGFGRVGQIVARILSAQHVSYTALEHSVEQVDLSRRFGSKIYYGDPSRAELLRAARAEHAEIFVLATDDPEANVRTARLVKRLYPHLKIYARARNRRHAFRLMDLQVDEVVRETLYSSLKLAEVVLEGLGVGEEEAKRRVEQFRQHDQNLLETQYQFHDDEDRMVQTTQEARDELEQLFDADRRERAVAKKD